MKALGTFKLKAVGHTVFPKQVDNKFVVSYNRHLLDIVEHVACTILEALLVSNRCKWVDWVVLLETQQ